MIERDAGGAGSRHACYMPNKRAVRPENRQTRRRWLHVKLAAVLRSGKIRGCTSMRVVGFDHLVLTVRSIPATAAFYTRGLGMRAETFGPDGRTALVFGPHKINLHQADQTFEPKAAHPTMGAADLCFLVDDIADVAQHLAACGIAISEGPVKRTGARGPMTSYYVRDPDQNLIELAAYGDGARAAA